MTNGLDSVSLLAETYCVFGNELLAVVATEFEVFLVDDVELGGDGLVVGDAAGVHALDEVVDMVGDFGLVFLNDLVVLDDDDAGHRGDEGYLAEFLFGEEFVFDLDDTLADVFLTCQVVADEDLVVVGLEAEDMGYLIYDIGGDMVDDGAVLDARYD